MSLLVVLCGLPGSGKTTLARALVAEHGGVRMNSDEWIVALGFDVFDSEARVRVEALQRSLLPDLLRAGTNVVVEWGVWTRAERDDLRAIAAEAGAAFELRYLDVPVDELWRRIEARNAEPMFAARPITRAELEEWTTWIEVPGEDER